MASSSLNHSSGGRAVADTSGVRCDVRSMRSVPHSLYTLPSISHVVATYVRQLMDDFASSLLLCRPPTVSAPVETGRGPGGSSPGNSQRRLHGVHAGANATRVGLVGEDEETYLLLQLCALDARRLRRERRAHHRLLRQTPHDVSPDSEKGGPGESRKRGDGSAAAKGNRKASPSLGTQQSDSEERDSDSDSDGDGDEVLRWLQECAAGRRSDTQSAAETTRSTLAAVESQLLAMFSAAERAHHSRDGMQSSDAMRGLALGQPTPSLATASPHDPQRERQRLALLLSPYLRRAAAHQPGPMLTEVLSTIVSTTPPLLSSLLRFKPLLRDLRFLSRHLLLPRHAWLHQQREWVSVHEDVSVTLRDRLQRFRWRHFDVAAGDADTDDDEDETIANASARCAAGPRVFPADDLEQLWHVLWETLGAAWRQRDRLWGAYQYLQGPRQLPPLMLNGLAGQNVPQSVHAAAMVRDQYTRHLMHSAAAASKSKPTNVGGTTSTTTTYTSTTTTYTSTTTNSVSDRRPQQQSSPLPSSSSVIPPSLLAAHAEDSCAFGPFTSADVGVSSTNAYVMRHPMGAVLRSLRVCVPAAGRDPLATSTAAFAGFRYLDEPHRRLASTVAGGSGSPAGTPPPPLGAAAAAVGGAVVPLFDPTSADVQLRGAAPYLSPEVYLVQQHRQAMRRDGSAGHAEEPAPVHCFSDDAWNAAVVVVEAALSGFAVSDPAVSHLSAQATAQQREASLDRSYDDGNDDDDRDASSSSSVMSPNAKAPPLLCDAHTHGPVSESVYAEVVHVLRSRHGLPLSAAHNFLYGTLFHLQAMLRCCRADESSASPPDVSGLRGEQATMLQHEGVRETTAPSPERLAQEWVRHLRAHYSDDFMTRVLSHEVAAKGLCWRRSERWNAFGLAHFSNSSGAATASVSAAASVSHGQRAVAASPGVDSLPATFLSAAAASPLDPPRGGQWSPRHGDAARSGDRDNKEGCDVDQIGDPSSRQQQQQQQQHFSRPALTLSALTTPPPSSLSSVASLDNLWQQQQQRPSAVQSPLRLIGSPHGSASFAAATPASPTSTTALARLPQQLDRAVNLLDTPLLHLFGLPGARDGAALPRCRDDAGDVWSQLRRYLHRSTTLAATGWRSGHGIKKGGAQQPTGGSAGGASAGKANGAVADAADVDVVEEVLRLLYASVRTHLQRTRQHDAREGGRKREATAAAASSVDDNRSDSDAAAQYAAVNHPFLRGVAERGLLTTYMTVCGCACGSVARNDGSPRQGLQASTRASCALPSLSLYVPSCVLIDTMGHLGAEGQPLHDATMLTTQKNGAAAAVDRLDVAAALLQTVERAAKQTGALRTLIGDDVRSWEAAKDASRRARAAYPSYYAYQLSSQQAEGGAARSSSSTSSPSSSSHQAQRAVHRLLSGLELSLPSQLHHTAELRRLLYSSAPGGATTGNSKSGEGARGSGGTGRGPASTPQPPHSVHAGHPSPTQAVREYLRSHVTYVCREATANRGTSSSANGHTAAPAAATTVSPFFPIPPSLRGEVWGCLLNVPATARKREAAYAHAVHHTAAKPTLNDRQLSVDIPRCHAYHPLLATSRGSAQLQRLLKAWLFQHPRYAYWQGLDSVCAVLLTVSPHDEPLVLAQLKAVVDRYIAHDEGGAEGGGAGGGSRSNLLHTPQGSVKPSMADQLHRLRVLLRYCDPLLAHYLFDVLGCTPELYAISWLLTLFSHSLPTRKVYLLWDLLFVHGDDDAAAAASASSSSLSSPAAPTGSCCLVALCAAVMMHRRAALLSTDFSGCLSAFSSGASSLDVAAAVGDSRQLLRVVPPSVFAQPCAEAGGSRQRPSSHLYHGDTIGDGHAQSGGGGPTAAYVSVTDLRAAWAAARARTSAAASPLPAAAGASVSPYEVHSSYRHQQQQKPSPHHWSDSGVYLIDIRAESGEADALLGAIHLPLFPRGAPSVSLANNNSSSSSNGNRNGGRYDFTNRSASTAAADPAAAASALSPYAAEEEDEEEAALAGDGWGIVDDQERLQQRQQREREALERHIADAAAELVRHLRNPAVAAITPRLDSSNDAAAVLPAAYSDGRCADGASLCGWGSQPPWEVHPIVLKTSMAPHVVLVGAGHAEGSGQAAPFTDGVDVALARQLAVELSACGVHNVSVLHGGMAAIRWMMPELVVAHAPSS